MPCCLSRVGGSRVWPVWSQRAVRAMASRPGASKSSIPGAYFLVEASPPRAEALGATRPDHPHAHRHPTPPRAQRIPQAEGLFVCGYCLYCGLMIF